MRAIQPLSPPGRRALHLTAALLPAYIRVGAVTAPHLHPDTILICSPRTAAVPAPRGSAVARSGLPSCRRRPGRRATPHLHLDAILVCSPGTAAVTAPCGFAVVGSSLHSAGSGFLSRRRHPGRRFRHGRHFPARGWTEAVRPRRRRLGGGFWPTPPVAARGGMGGGGGVDGRHPSGR